MFQTFMHRHPFALLLLGGAALWALYAAWGTPDLVVESFTATPQPPEKGKPFVLAGRVANRGTRAILFSTARLRWDWDHNGDWEGVLGELHIPPLRAGASRKQALEWSWTWQEAGQKLLGTHDFEFCVDPRDKIRERNERNNCTILSVFVES